MRALANALARAFDVLPTRWLTLHYVTAAQLAALLKQPVVAGLSHLTVQMGVGESADEAAGLLANCRHLRNLRGLALDAPFGDAGCAALAGAPWGNLDWFSPAVHNFTPRRAARARGR